jgi:hypothetical protein
VQKEIRHALDIAREKPEGTIFIIPAIMQECRVPETLRQWQWVNIVEDAGFGKLCAALKLRQNALAECCGFCCKRPDSHPKEYRNVIPRERRGAPVLLQNWLQLDRGHAG